MNRRKTTGRRPWKNAGICVLLAVFSALLYGNTISNRFVFDDIPLIVENRAIRDLSRVPQVLGLTGERPLYRPVRFLSYFIDYAVSGQDPAAYHAANMLYHALTGFVLYLVLMLLSGSRGAALAGALLFTAHPVHTDSVAYIAGRRDILCTLFYLAGFLCYVQYRREARTWLLLLTGLCYIMAVGSKEMAVTLPAVCLLYDTARPPQKGAAAARQGLRGRLLLYGGLLAVAAAYLYYKLVLYYPSLRLEYYGGSAASNFATVFRILARYIQLSLFPVVLHADYSVNAFRISRSFLEPAVLGSMALVAALLYGALRARRRSPLVFFGGLWFFITLLPVCHIVPHHEILAEHYLYLPSAGLLMLLTPLWRHLLSRRRTACLALLAAVLLLFSARTVVRNRDWKDARTLWSSVLETTPECARAHDNLGSEYFRAGDYRRALEHHRQAVRIRPEHAVFRNNLGMDYGATGDTGRAEKEFQLAVSLNPELAAAYNNLGIVYYKRGEYARAARFFQKSARRKPDARAWFNCGKAVLHMGRPGWAIAALEEALRLRPDYPEAICLLGTACDRAGNHARAAEAFRKAAALKPDYAEAYYGMARALLVGLGDPDGALRALRTCLQLRPGLKQAVYLTARAYDTKGDSLRAVQAYKQTLAAGVSDFKILYRIGVLYDQKIGDSQKALWYLTKAYDACRDPAARAEIRKAIQDVEGRKG